MSGRGLLVAIVVVAVACLLRLWFATQPPTEHSQLELPAAIDQPTPIPSPQPLERVRIEPGPASSTASFATVDESGVQLASVEIRSFDADHRVQGTPLGTSDERGQWLAKSLELASLVAGGGLAFSKAGYVTTRIDATEVAPGCHCVITLVRGHELSIRAGYADGRAVANARFALSLTWVGDRLVSDEATTDTVPGADPRRAVHLVETDESGAARLSGLAGGVYTARSLSLGLFPIRGLYDRRIEVPGPSLEVTMAPLHAAVFEIVGDEALGLSRRLNVAPPVFGETEDAQRAAETLLRQRFPTSTILVRVTPAVTRGDEHVAAFETFARHSGRVAFEVKMLPVDQIESPTRIDLPPPSSSDRSGTVVCSVFDAAGLSITETQLRLYWYDTTNQATPTMVFEVRPGVATRVPEGRYRLTALDPLLRNLLSRWRAFEVVAGRQNECRVDLDILLCEARLRVSDPRGRSLRRVNLHFAVPELLPSIDRFASLVAENVYVLPRERLFSIEARVFGYAAVRLERRIRLDEVSPIELTLKLVE